jgi:branched-chain amino acid transport system permease protein
MVRGGFLWHGHGGCFLQTKRIIQHEGLSQLPDNDNFLNDNFQEDTVSLVITNFIIFSSIYILLGWAIYLPYRCGQIYLAPIYCMAVGAYFSGYTSTVLLWPVWLSILLSPLAGALAAIIPALGLRRAPGFTVAISSMALIIISQTVIRNIDVLGKSSGMFGLPYIQNLWLFTVLILIIAGLFVHRTDHSRIGRAAELIMTDLDVAACSGINRSTIAIFLQTAAGGLSGVAGAIYAFNVGSIFPDAFGLNGLLNVFIIVFIGGTSTMWGPAIFAPILWGIPLILPEAVAESKDLIYGGILIAILLWHPEGAISRPFINRLNRFMCNLLGKTDSA